MLFCFGGLAVYGQSSDLKVEIQPAQTVVKNNEDFSVSTVIRNTGKNEQKLAVLLCCYSMLWTTDNPFVHTDCIEGCARNSAIRIQLKPGQIYEKTVRVRVEIGAGRDRNEPVTFRLGLNAATYRSEPKIPTIWSNAVTVNVTR